MADSEQAGCQATKGDSLHQLPDAGDVHTGDDHAVCNGAGDIKA